MALKKSPDDIASPLSSRKLEAFQEKLLEVVQRNPLLYNVHDKQYKNNILRNKVWQAVASEITTNGFPCTDELCRKRFATLMKRFRLEVSRERPSDCGSKRLKPFPLYDKMEFLIPYIEDSCQTLLINQGDSIEPSSSTQETSNCFVHDIQKSPLASKDRKRKLVEDKVMKVRREAKMKVKQLSNSIDSNFDWYDDRII